MNPDFRKVALIAASLGLLVSLFVALRPDEEDAASTATTATTAATAPPPATTGEETTADVATTAPAEPEVVRARIVVRADVAPKVRRLSMRRGRELVLVVESGLADHVHVHGYDLVADVAPGRPATIRFEATAPGLFEIELEERGLQIAELEVRP
jgi:pyruvate/2-oxoglutarate dehydrogenase complex dihydrolipoamide acyltransferase (E2) component